MKKKDPTSHRIIEKRRRDRMNNCLTDLSKLIPAHYMKQGRGRIEKTEIIEMAIKHLKDLIEFSQKQQQQQSQEGGLEAKPQSGATMTQSPSCSSSSMPSNSRASVLAPGPSACSASISPRASIDDGSPTDLMICQNDLQTQAAVQQQACNKQHLSSGSQTHAPLQANGPISAQDVQHLAKVNTRSGHGAAKVNSESNLVAASANTSGASLASAGASSSAGKSYHSHYHNGGNHHHHHHHHHHGGTSDETTASSSFSSGGGQSSGRNSSASMSLKTSNNNDSHLYQLHKYRQQSMASKCLSSSSGSDSGGSSSSLGSSFSGNQSADSAGNHRSASSSSSMRTSSSSSSVSAMNPIGKSQNALIMDRSSTTSLQIIATTTTETSIEGSTSKENAHNSVQHMQVDPSCAGGAGQFQSLPALNPVPMIVTVTNNSNGPMECCTCGARIIALQQANSSGSNSDSSTDNLSNSPNIQSNIGSRDYSNFDKKMSIMGLGDKSRNSYTDDNDNDNHVFNTSKSTNSASQRYSTGTSSGSTSSMPSSSSSSSSNSPPSSSSSSAWYKKAWLVRSFSRSPPPLR